MRLVASLRLRHYFLWHLKIRLGKKTPAITPAQLRLLLKTVLPLRVLDAEIIIELIDWIQLIITVLTCLTVKRYWKRQMLSVKLRCRVNCNFQSVLNNCEFFHHTLDTLLASAKKNLAILPPFRSVRTWRVKKPGVQE